MQRKKELIRRVREENMDIHLSVEYLRHILQEKGILVMGRPVSIQKIPKKKFDSLICSWLTLGAGTHLKGRNLVYINWEPCKDLDQSRPATA